MNNIQFYLGAIERLAHGKFDFEGTEIMAILTGIGYTPSAKDDVFLKDIKDEIDIDGYDRQLIEGRKVEVRSGQVVLAAKDIKFTLKDEVNIGALVIYDNSQEGKPLVAFKSFMNGDQAYHANPGTLMIELKSGLAALS